MSLTNYIRPGDALAAAAVVQDFTDLQTLANDVQPPQIKDWSLLGDALGTGWKSAQISVPAVPSAAIVPTGAAQSLHSSTFNTYTDEPVLIIAGCQVEFTGSPGELVLGIRIDGAAAAYKLAWEGGNVIPAFGEPVKFCATLPLIIKGKAGAPPALTDIALWSELDSGGAGTANWSVTYVQIEVLGVFR